jgi:NADH:ubiquinone oxidoreductase subunit E
MASDFRPEHEDITEDMWLKVDNVITEYKTKPGSIITVLRECQDVVGYLPVELIDYISRGMNLAPSDVFGVASFYALFSMEPKGRHTVKCCLGTACYVKGIKEVMERVSNELNIKEGGTTDDRRFSLEAVRCLGACGLAPVVVVNSDTYGAVKADGVIKILDKYE